MVELADSIVDDFDVVDVLDLLVERCVDVLGVGAASVTLRSSDGDARVVAASSDGVLVLELAELETNEGPCIDCLATAAPIIGEDLLTDDRWPRFASRMRDAHYRSVHVLPMRLRTNVIGALSLLHHEPGTMPAPDVEVAQAFADIATIAVLQHQATLDAQILAEQLNQALASRVVIEQAKGVLAERNGLDMDQAFTALRSHARGHNLRLAELARDIVDGTVTLAPPPLGVDPSVRRFAPMQPGTVTGDEHPRP